MASIRQRGKNSYAVVFQNGEGKNRKQEWESGYTKDDAKARKAQIEFEEARGIRTHTLNHTHHDLLNKAIEASKAKREIPTENDMIAKTAIMYSENDDTALMLKPFMEKFIKIYGAKKWGSSYYASGINLLNNYVYDYWASVPITDFTVQKIDEYYTWLITKCKVSKNNSKQSSSEYVTPSVVNDIHKLLRCAFNQGRKWGDVTSNPFLDVTVPEYKSKERPALTPNEIEKVLGYTDNSDNYDLFLIHCAMNLAFAGSMRGGEIGGLQWDDVVDTERRILYIHKAIDRVSKKALENTIKTKIFFKFPNYNPRNKSIIVLKNTKEDGGSDRNCYLPESVYKKLIKLREMQNNVKNELGDDGYSDYGLIICQENGRPIMTEHLNKRFQKVLNEMGIKPKQGDEQFVFHSIRSTATTYKLRVSGGDIKAVQGENGQKDPKMVTHQYSRIIDEDRIRLAEAMDNDFYRKEERKSEEDELMKTVKDNPELFKQFMAFMSAASFANKNA